MQTPDERFEALNLQLPPAPAPKGVYKPSLIVAHFIYVSGHGPYMPDDSLMTGRVGSEVDLDYGKQAAQQTGLAILATLKAALGSLNRVKRVVKVLGMVNAVPEFEEHPKVINGCSDLFAQIWGEENGIGVRSAVGMGSLPGNISVEIEAMFELEE
ncbi:MAG: RidA family protein [Cytophagales bacterium]|nr:MAG: RidA family protein [Cytophagales bacterium]